MDKTRQCNPYKTDFLDNTRNVLLIIDSRDNLEVFPMLENIMIVIKRTQLMSFPSWANHFHFSFTNPQIFKGLDTNCWSLYSNPQDYVKWIKKSLTLTCLAWVVKIPFIKPLLSLIFCKLESNVCKISKN